MKKLRVWLDDERPMPPGYTMHVKTPWEAIDLLKTGNVEEISLDFYLKLDSYEEPNTGYHVAQWIAEQAKAGTLQRLKVRIHTSCDETAWKMKACIREATEAWNKA